MQIKLAKHSRLWIPLIVLFSITASAQTKTNALDPAQNENTTHKPQIDVGVLATRGHWYAHQRWQPTIYWLNQEIPKVHFVLHPLDLDGMIQAVEQQRMDFILTNPGQAVRLGRQYALSWVATLVSEAPENSNYSIGSALVVRADSPYQTLDDVVGLPIAAVAEKAFGGYLTLRYQVIDKGLNPNDFFADVRYLGFPIDASLYQLRDNTIEAAVVPVCLKEQMENEGLIEQGQLRVLNPLDEPQTQCEVSTPLYPNWSFAKTERGSSQLAKQISRALLAMHADNPAAIAAKASGWTSPVSLLSIDKLYQAMDLHPLQRPWWKEALRWLRAHQEWAWALFLFVIVLNVYHFWLEYRFSKSKHALEQTQQRLKEKSELLEHSQRVAIVGELGSSLAHELNQPLAAIRNYSEGGLLRLAKNRPNQDIVPVLEKIQLQVERADAIVSRLRNLIKKRSVAISNFDLPQLITDTLELMQFRLQKQMVEVVCSSEGQQRPIEADMVGLQQVLVNVINNAIDACVSYADLHPKQYSAKIAIHTDFATQGVTIHILDNGTGLKQEHPTEAFVSSKQEGLGLGLSICRDVLEMHGGKFTIQSTNPHGCLVQLCLPFQAVPSLSKNVTSTPNAAKDTIKGTRNE